LDKPVAGFVFGAAGVGVLAEIGITVVGLGVLLLPVFDFVGVDEDFAIFDP